MRLSEDTKSLEHLCMSLASKIILTDVVLLDKSKAQDTVSQRTKFDHLKLISLVTTFIWIITILMVYISKLETWYPLSFPVKQPVPGIETPGIVCSLILLKMLTSYIKLWGGFCHFQGLCLAEVTLLP